MNIVLVALEEDEDEDEELQRRNESKWIKNQKNWTIPAFSPVDSAQLKDCLDSNTVFK